MNEIELERLNRELEEVKKEMEFYYLQGHNDETINSKYHKLLSEIKKHKV